MVEVPCFIMDGGDDSTTTNQNQHFAQIILNNFGEDDADHDGDFRRNGNRVSSDFKEALRKSVEWVKCNRGLQNKKIASDSFIRSLEQICTLKKKGKSRGGGGTFVKEGYDPI